MTDDSDSNEVINAIDFAYYHWSLAESVGDAQYLIEADYDGSGTINAIDFAYYHYYLAKNLPWDPWPSSPPAALPPQGAEPSSEPAVETA